MLKPLSIKPELIWLPKEEKPCRGYKLAQFKDAFERYLASEGTFKPLDRYGCDEIRTSDGFQTVREDSSLTVEKCEKSNNDGLPNTLTVEKGEKGVGAHCGVPDEPGLSWHTIDRLASEVEEWAYVNRGKVRTDQASVIEAEIRRRLIGAGVLPEAVAIETERVMTSLFEGREAARTTDGV